MLDWVPSGDDGYWAILARSVFSSRPPLLGSSSSGGVVTGTGFHHLGPLGFYLLAPFVALFGGVGVAVGAAVVNAAAAMIAPVAVRRGVGERAGWVVVVATALLGFTMGSELLVDPWNPHLAVLPLWCALCCTWSVLSGGVGWGAAGVFFASLSLQTHLSFVPVAGIAGVVLLVGTAWGCAHRERAEGAPWWRRWLPLFATLGAGLLANLVVAVQQLFGAGPGNLTNALTSGTGQQQRIGAEAGARDHRAGLRPDQLAAGELVPAGDPAGRAGLALAGRRGVRRPGRPRGAGGATSQHPLGAGADPGAGAGRRVGLGRRRPGAPHPGCP